MASKPMLVVKLFELHGQRHVPAKCVAFRLFSTLNSTTASIAEDQQQDGDSAVQENVSLSTIDFASAKPFSQIPKPPISLPLLGSLLDYKIGLFSVESYHEALLARYQRCGPLVRENFGGRSVVHVFDPDDARTVLTNDGKTPYISPLQETTLMYRAMRRFSLGLGNMNGPEWYRLRQAVQQLMMRPREVQHFLPLTESVAKDFIACIEQRADAATNHEVPNFRMLVLRWSLESSGYVVFEKRLNLLADDTAAGKLAQAMIDANQLIFKLSGELKFALPIFRYFSTPKWQKLVKAEDFFYGEAAKFVDEAVQTINSLVQAKALKDGQYTFLTYLLSRKELSQADVTIIALSLFGDGLNTTAPALIYALYCLAKNGEAQERLYREIRENVPGAAENLSEKVLASLPYLKACVKESQRLFPIGTEIARIVQKNLVLSGYQIPAQTPVDVNMIVHFRNEKYFSDPQKFAPERWLRGSALMENIHPFLMLSFGHGPRMCAGRRFAEQDLYVVLIRLLQKFRIEHHHGELRQEMKTLLLPKGSCQFAFVRR